MERKKSKKREAPDATVAEHQWETDPGDHCETAFEAYQHIESFLAGLANKLGKSRAELKIYDPYFCEGTMKRHLAKLGFTNVHNKNHDFYDVVKNKKVPTHDVLITSPPYSVDHMQRLVEMMHTRKKPFNKPWMLLLPDFVHRKKYWNATLAEANPFYLVPHSHYHYMAVVGGRVNNPQVCRHWKRDGVCQMGDACAFLHTDSAEALRVAKEKAVCEKPHLLAPYFSFWHIHLDDTDLEFALRNNWHRSNNQARCTLLKEVGGLNELLAKQNKGRIAQQAKPQLQDEPSSKELDLDEARRLERERVQKKRQKTTDNKSRNQLIREAEMAGLRKK